MLIQEAGKLKESLIWTGFKKDFQKKKLCRIIEKKMKKKDKKTRYHIKHFPENKIPRRVKMKAKLLEKLAYL